MLCTTHQSEFVVITFSYVCFLPPSKDGVSLRHTKVCDGLFYIYDFNHIYMSLIHYTNVLCLFRSFYQLISIFRLIFFH